jgi:hypothetical protein
VADVDNGERRRRPVRIGVLQKPAQKKFLATLEARFAEKKNAEKQDHEHQQNLKPESKWWSLHRAAVKRRNCRVTSDKSRERTTGPDLFFRGRELKVERVQFPAGAVEAEAQLDAFVIYGEIARAVKKKRS